MVKETPISYDELASVLAYDGENGIFTWRVMVGTKEGLESKPEDVESRPKWKAVLSFHRIQGSEDDGRRSLGLALQRVAGSDGPVYRQSPTNVRISNLKLADHKSLRVVRDDGTVGYKMHNEQVRHYALARYYNITVGQYAGMFSAQNGRCAICDRPETAKLPGRKTANTQGGVRFSVDHDHETEAVRQLLCNACNHMLGDAGQRGRLRAAADYLNFHRKALKDAS